MSSTLDLYCGCGGLSLGAVQAGLRPMVSIDVDRMLSSAYALNFPDSNLINADLLDVDPQSLTGMLGEERLTAIIGGPPCQGFSVMGRRDRDDPRNRLLGKYFDFVADLQPRFFLMENVPGLLDPENRYMLDAAMSSLPGFYNVLDPIVLDAADYGAATSRPRLIVVGYDPQEMDRLEVEDLIGAQVHGRANVRDAIGDLPEPTRGDGWGQYDHEVKASRYAEELRRLPARGLGDAGAVRRLAGGEVSGLQLTRHTSPVIQRFDALAPGKRDPVSKYPRLLWDRPAWVLRAGTGVDKGSYQAARPIHPASPRVITVREAARIQGFPDWYQFHPTKWHSHRMIGNSVSPIFAKKILHAIMNKMR